MQNILRLLGLLCMGSAWLLPNHYAPWTSFYNDSAMALGLLLIVASDALARRAPELPGVAVALIVVACIPWLQWAAGLLRYSGDAWVGSLYVLGFALAIGAGSLRARLAPADWVASLAAVAVAGSIASCLLGLVQVLQLNTLGMWSGDGVPGMRAEANLGQPNNLATLIGFGVLGLLVFREQGRIGTAVALLLLAIELAGAALTQSRSALLFGPLIAFGFVLAAWRKIPLRTRPLTVVAATAMHWALTWSWPSIQVALLQSPPASLMDRGAGSVRFRVWPILLDALSTVPMQGFGWLQVGAAELSAANRHPPAGELWLHGHNLFLELALWCGYPLGLLLGALVVYWFVSRAMRIRTMESLVGLILVGLVATHSMLELPHHYAYLLLPMGLWIGLIECQTGPPRPARPWGGAVLSAVCLLMVAAIWKDYLPLEDDFRRVRFESLRIGAPPAGDAPPGSMALSSLTEFLRFARTEPRQGMTAQELDAMDAATRRYPYAASLNRDATALALNGRLADAMERFVAIRHIHGDSTYQQARQALREKIADGQPALRELEASLPP